MLKYLLIMFLLTSSLFSKEPPFKYERMNTDYNGIVYNGKNTLCYGNYGIITYSTNRGEKWKQLNIGDLHKILKIRTVGKEFIGITQNSLIKSTDNGYKWQIVELNEIKDINQDNQIVDFSISNDSLLILTDFGVYLSNLELVKPKYILPLDDYTFYKSIESDNKFIYVACDTNMLIRYNKNSKVLDSIYINKSNPFLNIEGKKYIGDMKIINNELYMSLYLKDPTSNTSFILLKSKNNGEYWESVLNQSFTKCYIVENNNYFTIQPIYEKSFSNFFINFQKLDANKKLIKISLDSIGYFHSRRKYDCLEAFVKIGNDTIIAVGNNKMIVKSYNNGKNWTLDNLVNIYSNTKESIFFTSKNVIYGFNGSETYTSKDGGITWLPRKYEGNLSLNIIFSYFFNQNGHGVIRGYTNNISDTNVIIFDNYALNSRKFYNDTVYNRSSNQVYSIVNRNSIEIGNYHFNLVMFDSIFHLSNDVQKYHQFIRYNNEFKVDTIVPIYLKKIFGISVYNNEIFIVGVNSMGSYVTDSIGSVKNLKNKLFIYRSKDYGLNWDSIQIPYSQYIYFYNKTYYWGDDLSSVNPFISNNILYILANNKIISYDLLTNHIDSINTNMNIPASNLFKFDNKYFGVSRYNSIHYSKDIKNLINADSINCSEFLGDWSNMFPKSPGFLPEGSDYVLNSYTYNDSLTYLTTGRVISTGYDINLLKLYNSVIDTDVEEIEDKTYFYSYPPFPIPARNELKSLIYWDMSYNIDDSDIGVYDIYGNKITNRDKISINKLNSYSGYLTWDCSGIATGVYMIQIKHGTNTHNIRAMVVR